MCPEEVHVHACYKLLDMAKISMFTAWRVLHTAQFMNFSVVGKNIICNYINNYNNYISRH